MRCIKGTITEYEAVDPEVLAKDKAASRDRWFANLHGASEPVPITREVFARAADAAHAAYEAERITVTYTAHGGTAELTARNIDDIPRVLRQINRTARGVTVTVTLPS